MKTFIEQARFYAQYHQKTATFYTHIIGVPLIILSLMILLGFVRLVIPPNVLNISFADIATLLLWIYYMRLHWRLGLLILPVLVILLWIADLITSAGLTSGAFWTFVVLFVLGWLLQLAGHFIEGRRPALIDNFYQALVAPLYLTAEVCFMAGYMQSLKQAMHGTSEHTEIVMKDPESKE
ncbi:DUF962 domain-containing protein [Legionella erythra]|uniref:Transmembrane protein n=1 Tax=Legionella erythra TaxID=448 RepID=A0A0W0TGS2_LEGER|nr:Mpo1-like protein [Legionella erythra]KTC94669.1 transmembrane protein [Legionella erythra]